MTNQPATKRKLTIIGIRGFDVKQVGDTVHGVVLWAETIRGITSQQSTAEKSVSICLLTNSCKGADLTNKRRQMIDRLPMKFATLEDI